MKLVRSYAADAVDRRGRRARKRAPQAPGEFATAVASTPASVFPAVGEGIIDYKTDRGGVSTTTKYDAQLKAYREMWEKMTGGEVRSELISTRANRGSEA